MPVDKVLDLFKGLTIWKNKSQRAPHKPLLILIAISEMVNNRQRYILYSHIRERLIELLNQYGPKRAVQKPEEPFSRLPKDGVWELIQQKKKLPIPKDGISNKALIEHQIAGGFTELVWQEFHVNPDLIVDVINHLLTAHFTETYHEDILKDLALDSLFGESEARGKKTRLYKPRDPKFRNRILEIYNYSCCICGYNLRIAHSSIGLEAAHIKWHQAGGADNEQNGVALCSIHHKLLDYGAITLNNKLQIKASDKLNGDRSILQHYVFEYIGNTIHLPRNEKVYPKITNIEWHVSEVFKG